MGSKVALCRESIDATRYYIKCMYYTADLKYRSRPHFEFFSMISKKKTTKIYFTCETKITLQNTWLKQNKLK